MSSGLALQASPGGRAATERHERCPAVANHQQWPWAVDAPLGGGCTFRWPITNGFSECLRTTRPPLHAFTGRQPQQGCAAAPHRKRTNPCKPEWQGALSAHKRSGQQWSSTVLGWPGLRSVGPAGVGKLMTCHSHALVTHTHACSHTCALRQRICRADGGGPAARGPA